jgi:hypothetical protein
MGLVLHIFFVVVDKIFITNLRFEIWGWGNLIYKIMRW